MILLRQLADEIFNMFAGDPTMSVLAVAIVGVAAALHFLTPLPSSLIGIGLVIGCLTLLILRVFSHAHKGER